MICTGCEWDGMSKTVCDQCKTYHVSCEAEAGASMPEPKSRKGKFPLPTEQQDQEKVANWLRLNNVTFFHVPNEGRHKAHYRIKQIRQGMQAGVPDFIIVDAPPAYKGTGIHSVAIELKRLKGGTVSAHQKKWLLLLEERGWYTAVCHGADAAIKTLEGLGYKK